MSAAKRAGEACGVARPRPVAAAESSACGRGNAVGLTSIEDSFSSIDFKLTVIRHDRRQ